jgi:hypothetical protein
MQARESQELAYQEKRKNPAGPLTN